MKFKTLNLQMNVDFKMGFKFMFICSIYILYSFEAINFLTLSTKKKTGTVKNCFKLVILLVLLLVHCSAVNL